MNKFILKISGIIAILVGIGWCFTIIGIIVGVPLIYGGSKILEYANLSDKEIIEKKSSILNWGIFFLFFTVVGGILVLFFYLSMDKIEININGEDDYVEELKKLDELHKQGIISDKEYEAKKKKILNI